MEIIQFILIFKILLLSFVISKFSPLHWLLDILNQKVTNTFGRLLLNLIGLLLTCFNCLCLWCGFVLGGFWIGIYAYCLSYVYSNSILSSWERIYVNNLIDEKERY